MPLYGILSERQKGNLSMNCLPLIISLIPRIPVYASAGEMYDGDIWPDNLIAEALKLKSRGFRAYKFRPGTHWSVSGMTMSKYIDGVWKIREAVGDDFGLIQECNAQWNMDQTMQFIPEAEKMKLDLD